MQVFHLLQEMAAELPADMPVNHTNVLQKIDELFTNGLILVAERDGKIVGSIGVGPKQWWFSDRWFLGDDWIFVSEKHRKSRIAVQMLRKIKEFADKTGLPLGVSVFSFNQVSRKSKLFRRYFTPVGETYFYFPK